MKSVLVCTSSKDVYQKLSACLAEDGVTVEAAYSHADVLNRIQEGRRDAVIAEARRDHFADFLRSLCRMQPDLLVHLVSDGRIFCHYPFSGQPVPLLFALDNAGLILPSMVSSPAAEADWPSVVLDS